MPAVRDVGLAAGIYCDLGPLTKITQIGNWPKNAVRVSQRGGGAS